MSRNLDSSLQAALANSLISPVILAAIAFKSGTAYVWSGVGDLAYGGNTYKGVGSLSKISPVQEGVSVQADGMTIALSGIEAIPFSGGATPPTGLRPPVTVPAGTYVAWAEAGAVATLSVADGTISAGLDSCVITRTKGIPGDTHGNMATWSSFSVSLPPDAVITALYPTAVATTLTSNELVGVVGATLPAMPFSGVQVSAASIGTALATLEGASLSANVADSIYGASPQTLDVSSLRIAVYYTSASNAFSAINEALSDIQLGASAQIYFGLMSGGALIGSPYLIFAGQVDQPTVDVDANAITISLALENRLSNLARPTARRYTAADQHLAYPDDIAFNWVETLNDIALRWGS